MFSIDIISDESCEELENEVVANYEALENYLLDCIGERVSDAIISEARAIIEGAKALTKSSKREKLTEDPTTKLNVLIELEKEICNFDVEQRKIAISLINGPQRIRGLAGSGKTIVLAMKAAHIHLQYPEKKILFTFYTKSLYGLIKDLIARFFRHFAADEPNWENIDILHAWGGYRAVGVYYNACIENSLPTMNFDDAKRLNYRDPFSAICAGLTNSEVKHKYDYILIDEAQDLPNEFFQLCYKLAVGSSGENKNIVWAYDELQSIFNVYQRTPEELFGTDDSGAPRISLNEYKKKLVFGQDNDLVLYKCYRNPLEVLMTAHALGFGIYSEQPVQMLENKEHWEDVGYKVLKNEDLEVGAPTIIARDRENSPLSINKYQKSEDLIKCVSFKNIQEEASWIAEQLIKNIEQGLKANDLLVICLDDRYAKSYFKDISYQLSEAGIRTNNLLASSSATPPFYLDGMITLSTVHRAKGNEAAFVYCCGIDALTESRGLRKVRNKLFTAFTRTKAWLRVSGIGESADLFLKEIAQSLSNSPNLVFDMPDIATIDTIQRDLSKNPKLEEIREKLQELREQGVSEEEIQMELSLSSRGSMSNKFGKSIREAMAFLHETNYLLQAGSSESLRASKEFLMCSRRASSYKEIYDTGLRYQDFNFMLLDESFFQFTQEDEGELRLAYYPNPNLSLEYRKDKAEAKNLYELGELTHQEYEQLLSESQLDIESSVIRYDFSAKQYCKDFHPAAHLHIGFSFENRWPVQKILSPFAFTLKILMIYHLLYRKKVLESTGQDILDQKYRTELSSCLNLPSSLLHPDEQKRMSFGST